MANIHHLLLSIILKIVTAERVFHRHQSTIEDHLSECPRIQVRLVRRPVLWFPSMCATSCRCGLSRLSLCLDMPVRLVQVASPRFQWLSVTAISTKFGYTGRAKDGPSSQLRLRGPLTVDRRSETSWSSFYHTLSTFRNLSCPVPPLVLSFRTVQVEEPRGELS